MQVKQTSNHGNKMAHTMKLDKLTMTRNKSKQKQNRVKTKHNETKPKHHVECER